MLLKYLDDVSNDEVSEEPSKVSEDSSKSKITNIVPASRVSEYSKADKEGEASPAPPPPPPPPAGRMPPPPPPPPPKKLKPKPSKVARKTIQNNKGRLSFRGSLVQPIGRKSIMSMSIGQPM